jgi:hypothetical protein
MTTPAVTGRSPDAPDPIDLIHSVVPELTRAQVLERMQELFQAEGAALEAKLDRHAKELQYELIEDWEFRGSFLQEPAVRALVQPAVAPLRTTLTTGRWASRTLISQLID